MNGIGLEGKESREDESLYTALAVWARWRFTVSWLTGADWLCSCSVRVLTSFTQRSNSPDRPSLPSDPPTRPSPSAETPRGASLSFLLYLSSLMTHSRPNPYPGPQPPLPSLPSGHANPTLITQHTQPGPLVFYYSY